ncbi:MAG: phenylacetate--CoA ligase family protein, partial [Phycisphaerales bacterium]
HAYNHTGYYRTLFDKYKLNPDSVEHTRDLRRIPVLTKSDVQKNCESMLSRTCSNRQDLIEHNTSGSTGTPLRFYRDQRAEAWNRALKYRAFVENGLSLRDVVVEITSSGYVNTGQFWFRKFGILRRHKFSIMEEPAELFVKINSLRPDIIECYPSVLNLMAQNCDKTDLRFRPKVIFTTAELLLPAWRRNIVSFFDCDVRDMYGSSEFYRLAWECEKHEGYHLDIDAHVIEFLDENDNPVTEGDACIVVTGLYNTAFPLIRYRLGDMARLKQETKCSCGRTLPLIDSIQGRQDDYIKLPSGKTISPRRINLLDTVKGIDEYITTQIARDVIRIEAVKNADFAADTIESIKKQIRSGCLGEDIKVEVEFVEKIKRKAGKIRTVTS